MEKDRRNGSWFGKDEIKKLIGRYLEGNTVSFSNKEIDLCYKITRGYPYFLQNCLYLMYYEKVKNKATPTVDIIESIKKEYGKIFEATIENWGKENMPKRTFNKILDMIGQGSKKIIKAGFEEMVRAWVKSQF